MEFHAFDAAQEPQKVKVCYVIPVAVNEKIHEDIQQHVPNPLSRSSSVGVAMCNCMLVMGCGGCPGAACWGQHF